MRIIIEGVDGCLKTTIAKQIVHRIKEPYTYVKEKVPPKDMSGFDYYMKRCDELPVNCVVDRFHLGEAIYPVVKQDGRVALTPKQIYEIEKKLKATSRHFHNALILCSSSKDWREYVYDGRGEDFITLDQSEEVKKSFEFAYIVSTISPRYRFFVDDYLAHSLNLLDRPTVNHFEFVTQVLENLQLHSMIEDFIVDENEYNERMKQNGN